MQFNKLLFTVLFSSTVTTGLIASRTPTMSTPKLTISGQSTFNAWWFKNKNLKFRNDGNFGNGLTVAGDEPSGDTEQGYGRGYLFTLDDSRLKFDVAGKTDPGMDYGFVVVFNTDTQQTSYDKTIKENYIWAGGSWGRLTMGDTDGVEDIMAFGGFDVLGGTGGFDGNFDRVVNFVTGTVTSVDLVGDTNKATKVMYQSPRYYGFQAGISFTPQSNHLGEGKINSSTNSNNQNGSAPFDGKVLAPFDSSSIAGGLNFLNRWNNGFEWGISGTAIFAKTHPGFTGAQWFLLDDAPSQIAFIDGTDIGSGNRRNTRAFAIGTVMRYSDFEFGFEYGDNGRSGELKNIQEKTGFKTNAGWFIDYGFSYHYGATKFSIGHMYAKRKAVKLVDNTSFARAKNRTQILSASIDHKLAPGVGLYFEYAHYDMKNEGFNVDAMIQNSGNVVPAGAGFSTLSNGAVIGPVGPKQKSNAFVLGSKVKF